MPYQRWPDGISRPIGSCRAPPVPAPGRASADAMIRPRTPSSPPPTRNQNPPQGLGHRKQTPRQPPARSRRLKSRRRAHRGPRPSPLRAQLPRLRPPLRDRQGSGSRPSALAPSLEPEAGRRCRAGFAARVARRCASRAIRGRSSARAPGGSARGARSRRSSWWRERRRRRDPARASVRAIQRENLPRTGGLDALQSRRPPWLDEPPAEHAAAVTPPALMSEVRAFLGDGAGRDHLLRGACRRRPFSLERDREPRESPSAPTASSGWRRGLDLDLGAGPQPLRLESQARLTREEDRGAARRANIAAPGRRAFASRPGASVTASAIIQGPRRIPEQTTASESRPPRAGRTSRSCPPGRLASPSNRSSTRGPMSRSIVASTFGERRFHLLALGRATSRSDKVPCAVSGEIPAGEGRTACAVERLREIAREHKPERRQRPPGLTDSGRGCLPQPHAALRRPRARSRRSSSSRSRATCRSSTSTRS